MTQFPPICRAVPCRASVEMENYTVPFSSSFSHYCIIIMDGEDGNRKGGVKREPRKENIIELSVVVVVNAGES